MNGFKLDCVLFDLDGTLVDTAPDLVACLNQALAAYDLPATRDADIKHCISMGALAMIKYAAPNLDSSKQNQLLDYMLDCYQSNIAAHSRFFDGISETLATIETLGLKWGVVTNKRERFTLPLMDALNLSSRAACVVSGDTTANSKPHPEPMLAACRQAGVSPENCVYIGDASHDIAAGKNANMKTLAALYGYIKENDQPENWGADALIEHPQQLQQWIQATLCH
ncbi:HAD family hydrolase [Methylomonas methanica]|uniref:Phosphoglycolate phosphatase n=1 Tax=Methylomonas methanica (strain DSM 25384 / MC09) TaxID=857087 RepID=G0A1W0_METMM|nr:HAD-IA family hydrolase [Methylomonas methanica]AEG01343.1 phosphoglycolate phosphatase [Methylomonas methanica MC09]